jgi:CBS domain-containing protein
MSRSLLTVETSEVISSVYQRLSKSCVAQLPVLETGKLVGIISITDLALAEFDHLTVGAIMSQDFYMVSPDAPVDVTAREMARHKYHAAVIVECGYPQGVFTTTDALRALSDSLTDSLPGADALA